MENLVFKELNDVKSQLTLVRLLEENEYYFQPINEYESKLFNCMIRMYRKDAFKQYFPFLSKIFKRKEKVKFTDCPLAFNAYNGYIGESINKYIVFTRNDVMNIISDVPKTYIGGKEI